MRHVDCVVIGAGQAGLAMSRCLTDRAVPHVVLERGLVAERWRSERWASLRLLTPNWQSRLPGFRYDGADPDGYMTMPEVVDYLERYAASFDAPVLTGVDVADVSGVAGRFRVVTSLGTWSAAAVVIATGYAQRPWMPRLAADLPAAIAQLAPTSYRRPADVAPGAVLVVGASASGVQLADELQRAGREVTIAVGQHTRLPRVYRRRDVLWWLDAMGVFDESAEQVFDVERSREQPSLQLVGDPTRRTLDLARLQSRGVRVVGRLVGIDGTTARFADDLVATTAAADFKLASLLQRIDGFIAAHGLEAPPAPPFVPHFYRFIGADTTLDLAAARVGTVIWATGFRREYPWLRLPILDGRGEIRQQGGVTVVPGVYAIGLHFMRRRKSSFIDGVGADAVAVSAHLAEFLRRSSTSIRRDPAPGSPVQLAGATS